MRPGDSESRAKETSGGSRHGAVDLRLPSHIEDLARLCEDASLRVVELLDFQVWSVKNALEKDVALIKRVYY